MFFLSHVLSNKINGPFKTTLELSLEKAKHGQIPQMAPPHQHIKKQHSPFHHSIPKISCIFWLSLAKSSILPCSTPRRNFMWRDRNGRESHGGSHDGLACKSRSGPSVERRWRLFVPLVSNVFDKLLWGWWCCYKTLKNQILRSC